MKIITTLMFFILISASFAHADSGNVLICASDDNEIKMTADLSDGKNQKVAKAMMEGIPVVYQEASHGKSLNKFDFYADKSRPLTITPKGSKVAVITLTTDPERNESQVIHETNDPSHLKISKFKATLNVPKLEVSQQAVTCTETNWRE